MLKTSHRTKSEFFREMLRAYFRSIEHTSTDTRSADQDIAYALKLFWDTKTQAPVTIVVGLGIIEKNGKVLIGGRKKKDPHVKKLSWVFPGGKMESLDFASEVVREIREETGLDISVRRLISARVHPDSHAPDVQVVALYFACSVVGRAKEMVGGEFTELRWVDPTDVYKYFTTSVSDDVARHLVALEKAVKP